MTEIPNQTRPETVVIDYGSGNLRSAAKALERAAREANIDTAITVTADAAALAGDAEVLATDAVCSPLAK